MSIFDEIQYASMKEKHTALLAAAKERSRLIWEAAQLTLQAESDNQEAKLLKARADALEKSVAAAEKKAKEECRIRDAENKARAIPQPAPRLPTPPAPTAVQTPPVDEQAAPVKSTQAAQPTTSLTPTSGPTVDGLGGGLLGPDAQPTSSPSTLPPAQPTAAQPTQLAAGSSQPPPAAQQPPPTSAEPSTTPVQQQAALHPQASVAHILPNGPRYVEIYGLCKDLRKFIAQQTTITLNVPNQNGTPGNKPYSVKEYAGELRRALTRTMGQLTEKAGTNTDQLHAIRKIFVQSLETPSPTVDPRRFLVTFPEGPVEGAVHNGDEMPCLFIYIVNIFAKAVVAQLSNEAGVNPRIAEPIGIIVHNIITFPAFLWRGKSLVDIIMAKFRVSLPVVFGERGNERTEEGRKRLGWKRIDGGWISEQAHNDRMRGLGAGYAALCLRNYTKSTRENPWPATYYWNAIALIVDTPPQERNQTQALILNAMIEGFEKKFIDFYGNMAVAALRAALITFPNEASEQTAAIKTLMVLGERLKRDTGLTLA
ncbi:GLE1-like protein [Diplocarpon rosae]|nr:GLE1-like protein [Diplocarpon rosae]